MLYSRLNRDWQAVSREIDLTRLRGLRPEHNRGQLSEDPITSDDGAIFHVPSGDEDPPVLLSGARALRSPPGAVDPPSDPEDGHSLPHSHCGARPCISTQHGPLPLGHPGIAGLGRQSGQTPPQNAPGAIRLVMPLRLKGSARIPRTPGRRRRTNFAGATKYPHCFLQAPLRRRLPG